MNFQLNHRNHLVLPSWIGKTVAFLVFLVGLGVLHYGIHDGIINKDIAYRTKSGDISIGNGFIAVMIGVAFSGIGIALIRAASLISKSNR